ncbi:hypothetical protein COU19_02980 [Candidatus Kaiserbacteria bacterium CG10_big_fil_rev_8_21_14_0_10_56_12]|uniref:FMN-binding domain-containing protein n=1 Tax=Candidatus Kaiserbacteria bacterium CG10_big_fil_rev_8_21_14_0_10_56_12 TaxID=1974611 RepID=A0A2H0U9D5_9BACT|nr:MAG: hypothetical protein COU19_02980 [Candidatus Kaiserbacteria bacterium CG10_big_fil_rev_8_21_14_0_10_56_12]
MKYSQITVGVLAVAMVGLIPLSAAAFEVEAEGHASVSSSGEMHSGDDMMNASFTTEMEDSHDQNDNVHSESDQETGGEMQEHMGTSEDDGSATSTIENGKGMEVNAHAEAGQETAENVREDNGAAVTLMKNAAGVTVENPAQVTSDDDLEVYVHNVPASDARITAVAAPATNKIEVAYKHRAYLFGFIPVTATTRTTVSANASGTPQVTTTYPWWNFLASGDGGIAEKVDTTLAKDTAIQAIVQGSASARAAVIAAIVAAHAELAGSAQ